MKKVLLHFLVVCLFTSKVVFGMNSSEEKLVKEQKQKLVKYWQMHRKCSKPFQEAAKRHLEKINFNETEEGSRVLHFCCESGDVTFHIAHELCPKSGVFGFAFTNEATEVAQELERENLFFSLYDAAKQECYGSFFDYVISLLSLHIAHSKVAFVRSIFKFLRPEGKIFLTAEDL